MAYDEYGSYIPDEGISMWDYYNDQAGQFPIPDLQYDPQFPNWPTGQAGPSYFPSAVPSAVMNNTSWETTDPNQGFGVPNSYGLATQPYQPPQSQGAWIQNYAPSNAGIWSPTPQPMPQPIQQQPQQRERPPEKPRGGSTGTILGTRVDINDMAEPYGGGATAAMTAAGYKPPGAMPSTLMDLYTKFLQDPSSSLNNPLYKAILEQGTANAERGVLARGGLGSGMMPVELQKAGIAATAPYLNSMADIYRGGALAETGRYGVGATAGEGAGRLGLSGYAAEAEDQYRRARGNYGVGQDLTAQIEANEAKLEYGPLKQFLISKMMRDAQGY